jgi:hypothetical protein
MSFFTYSQNNSGGSFYYDAEQGITYAVIVEAGSPDAADARAESIGLYFDGCSEGRDCDCCGDRWDKAYGKGDATPLVYGKTPGKFATECPWKSECPQPVCVHYADGSKAWFSGTTEAES